MPLTNRLPIPTSTVRPDDDPDDDEWEWDDSTHTYKDRRSEKHYLPDGTVIELDTPKRGRVFLPDGRVVDMVYETLDEEWQESGRPYRPREGGREDRGLTDYQRGSLAISGGNLAQRQREHADKLTADALKREYEEKKLALDEASDKVQAELKQAELEFKKAKQAEDLDQAERFHNDTMRLQAQIRKLDEAKFTWQKEYEGKRLGIEEQQGRVREAEVTGYYRRTPNKSLLPGDVTGYQAPAQQLQRQQAAQPTLAREQFQATQATQPIGFPQARVATAPLPTAPPPQQQQGPPATGLAAQAPYAQPSEAEILAMAAQVQREMQGG